MVKIDHIYRDLFNPYDPVWRCLSLSDCAFGCYVDLITCFCKVTACGPVKLKDYTSSQGASMERLSCERHACDRLSCESESNSDLAFIEEQRALFSENYGKQYWIMLFAILFSKSQIYGPSPRLFGWGFRWLGISLFLFVLGKNSAHQIAVLGKFIVFMLEGCNEW